jgi:hypothetical protein
MSREIVGRVVMIGGSSFASRTTISVSVRRSTKRACATNFRRRSISVFSCGRSRRINAPLTVVDSVSFSFASAMCSGYADVQVVRRERPLLLISTMHVSRSVNATFAVEISPQFRADVRQRGDRRAKIVEFAILSVARRTHARVNDLKTLLQRVDVSPQPLEFFACDAFG